MLRKIEGLSTREVADRLKINAETVERQTIYGMRALVDFMLGAAVTPKDRLSPSDVGEAEEAS